MTTTTEKREHLEALITLAEKEAKSRPHRYRFKVASMALLGYLVIFGMLFTLLAISIGVGWAAVASSAFAILLLKKKLIVVLLAMIYVLARALWVKFEAPGGYRLTPKQYPRLFAELKKLSRKLKAPAIHQVILVPEYNAAVVQTPRLGMFGFSKNTLLLGLELLLSLSPAQAEAVIAHELGHLSGAHGRFGGWIYRVRLSWHRIMTGLECQENIGVNLMRRFFDWYAPAFAAYSFALARSNEFSADAVAAKLTSRQDMAQALVNTCVVGDLVQEQFWTPFFKQAETNAHPIAPFVPLRDFLRNPVFETDNLRAKVDEAMTVVTGHYDTHPALKDRLQALQADAPLPQLPADSAAQAWLGDQLEPVLADFDRNWLQFNEGRWLERYQYCSAGRAQLVELQQLDCAQLNAEQYWQLATLTEEFLPDTDPLPLFQNYRAVHSDANADFVIGRLLLKRDDPSGVSAIQKAMEAKPELALDGYRWLEYFYRRQGHTLLADHWLKQVEKQLDINRLAQLERQSLTPQDRLVRPEAEPAMLNAIRESLAGLKGIVQIWLAEKAVKHYPDAKVYVFVFAKKRFASEKKISQQLVERLQIPNAVFVLAKGGQHAALAKKAIKAGIKL